MIETASAFDPVDGVALETSGRNPSGEAGASGVGMSTPIEANTV
jgi:hypothetical protein